jgi:hypothetical protein
MRITVKLDGFEGAQPAAFAILWLDRETRRWSREGHQAVDMPDWGGLRCASDGTTICCQKNQHSFGVLEQFDVNAPGGPAEGREGRVVWYADGAGPQMTGRWHVQCIDRDSIKAERSVFAGEQDAWTI